MLRLSLACTAFLAATDSFAEKRKDNHQSPLTTIMQTRLWADTPDPKDFVKDHRPPASKLKFQPLTGTDPERPKLRTPAELKDLDTELEAARLRADKKAGVKYTPPSTVSSSNKPKAASATE